MSKYFYVYILTNKYNRVLYTGITNDLRRRIYEHKNKLLNGFTKKYNTDKLVYFEYFTNVHFALRREKEIKGWIRNKKIELINSFNSDWKDLSENL